MGDDPFVPVADDRQEVRTSGVSSNASGNKNITVNNYSLTTGQLVLLVGVSCLALGLSIGAVVMMATSQTQHREAVAESITASERRTMDRASMAEREARMAQDEIQRLQVQLKISTNH